MKSNTTEDIGLAILNAHTPSKFQLSYLQKTKALSSSKSSKEMHSLLAHSNTHPFKKRDAKQQVQTNEKEPKKSNKLESSHVKRQGNKLAQKTNSELNKIINTGHQQTSANPQHFLLRTQLFEKQKQQKLQLERRKQLYGAVPDKAFQPNIIKKEINEEKNTLVHEESQRQRTYKAMHYKKYGKIKLQEQSRKKKQVKKYEQLMKQSIQRFNQKFKSIGNDETMSKPSQSHKKQLGQLSNTQETVNVTKIMAVQQKIKNLMNKLNLQDQINLSIQSIEQLSRIQMVQDHKQSEVNSSNLFNKVYEDMILEETTKNILPLLYKKPQQINISHAFRNTELQKPILLGKNLGQINSHSLNIIENENIKIRIIQKDQMKQNMIDTQHNQKETQIEAFFEQLFIEIQIAKVNRRQHKQTNEFVNKQKHQQEINKNGQIHFQQSQINAQQISINLKQSSQKKIQQIYQEKEQIKIYKQDILIPTEISHHESDIPFIDFNVLYKGKVMPHIMNGKGQIIMRRASKNIGQNRQIKEETQQQIILINKDIKKTKENQEKRISIEEYQSSQDTFQIYRQSFTDLKGNSIKGVQVQVKNFGFCRFLIATEESEIQFH